jgi:hypothetical protein
MTRFLTYYKATRPDGTSFYDGTTKWQVGRIVRHPAPDLSLGLCSAGVLHISDTPGEVLIGGSWPCRLFEVEPRGELVSDDSHKHGCAAVEVVRELPAWQALGPNGEVVAGLIEQCKTLTNKQAKHLAVRDAVRDAARDAACDAAWHAAWDAARRAAWDAAWNAAQNAARGAARNGVLSGVRNAAWNAAYAARGAVRDAVLALMVRDLITAEQFDLLYGPWREVMES